MPAGTPPWTLRLLRTGVFTSLLIVIALLHFYTKTSPILLFWMAFVLTGPFGATFGDLLTKPLDDGGLNLGTIGASIFFAAVMACALGWELKNAKGIVEEPAPPAA